MRQLTKIKECTEVQMKVPWGHISGKWWGPQTVRPILAIHGWLDNAGSYDTLAPLLPDHISLLAIDLPGHGLSSRLPDGSFYHTIDYVYIVRIIQKEYNWDKISLLGHSMGATVSFWFASMYPDDIDLLIGIEVYRPSFIPIENYMSSMAQKMNGSLLADERNTKENEPPSYSYEDCIEKLYHGTNKSVDKDKCPYLLTRNITRSQKYPDKYYFSRDSRVKYITSGMWPQELYYALMSKVRIPYLLIRAKQARIQDKMENYESNIAMLKTNPLFEYYEVDGSHHVHLNNLEIISEYISQFLMKHVPLSNNNIKSKL